MQLVGELKAVKVNIPFPDLHLLLVAEYVLSIFKSNLCAIKY